MNLDENFTVCCPYCGEEVSVQIEPDVVGELVQDCEVCCNPWLIRIEGRGENRSISVSRGDGSA